MHQALMDWVHNDHGDDEMRMAAHQMAEECAKDTDMEFLVKGPDEAPFIRLADLITLNSIVLLTLEQKAKIEEWILEAKY